MRAPVVGITVTTLMLVGGPVSAEERRAMVVANGAYEGAPVPGAKASAELVGEALFEAGFEVTYANDADLGTLGRAVDFLAEATQPGDVALFVFVGRAAQAEGANYLLPVGAPLASPAELATGGFALEQVWTELDASEPGAILVLVDAEPQSGIPGATPGLHTFQAPEGVFVAHSAIPGAEQTGDGPSPFASALADALPAVDVPLARSFADISGDVRRWSDSGLPDGFVLVRSEAPVPVGSAPVEGLARPPGTPLDAPPPEAPRLLNHEEPWFPVAAGGVATTAFSLVSAIPISIAFQQGGCQINEGECPIEVNYPALGVGLALFGTAIITGGILLGVANKRRKQAARARGFALRWRGPGRGLAF